MLEGEGRAGAHDRASNSLMLDRHDPVCAWPLDIAGGMRAAHAEQSNTPTPQDFTPHPPPRSIRFVMGACSSLSLSRTLHVAGCSAPLRPTGDCGWASSRTRTTRASGDPHCLDPWSGDGRAPPCDRDTPGDCDRDTASKSSPATPPLALPRTGTSRTGSRRLGLAVTDARRICMGRGGQDIVRLPTVCSV